MVGLVVGCKAKRFEMWAFVGRACNLWSLSLTPAQRRPVPIPTQPTTMGFSPGLRKWRVVINITQTGSGINAQSSLFFVFVVILVADAAGLRVEYGNIFV